MDWHTLLTRERLGKPAPSSAELGRSPFHKDHDRIIFSGAFRRLGRKTQVHPVSSNDHIHTRLTHSLEVAQIARSLAAGLGLDHDLAEAVADAEVVMRADAGRVSFPHQWSPSGVMWVVSLTPGTAATRGM